MEKHFTPNIPAWCMKPPEILFDLHSEKKSESKPHILKDHFRKMQSRYKNYQQIYTDGSKEDSKVGCAVISNNHSNMQRIPDDSSIFTAEAKAIDLALDFIINLFFQNLIAIFKIIFCFAFVSDHNTDFLMLYSVQLKNMYSYLNSSVLYVVSPVNNRIATNYHYTNSSSSLLLFYLINFYFFHLHHV